MPLPQEQIYTIEDIYALPEGTRAELLHGQIYMMAPPSRLHQDIAGRLYARILQYIESRNGSCLPYMAPFAVFLNDDRNYVEPDVSVICDHDKLDDKGCHGAPDFVIEVVSPSSKSMDYFTKLTLYHDSGVKEYWIIDPSRETILVYLMEKSEVPVIYHFSDVIQSDVLNNFNIRIKDLLH